MSARILKGQQCGFKETRGLGQLFFEKSEEYGRKTCQIDGITGEKETYASVKRRSTLAAIHMRKLGITSEDVLMFCSKNNIDVIIPVLAALYLGAKVSSVDPTHAPRDCAYYINIVKPRFIFTEEDSVDLIEAGLMEGKFDSTIVVIGNSRKYKTLSQLQLPSSEENDFRPVIVDCHETAFIYFSSGTTGYPKGICITSFGLVNSALSTLELDHLKPDVIYHVSTLYWVSSGLLMTVAFLTGGARVMLPKFDAETYLQSIQKYKITYTFMPPMLIYSLTSMENGEEYDTSSLYTMVLSGTVVSEKGLEKAKKLFKSSFITNGYGCTEASGFISLFEHTKDRHLTKDTVQSCGKCQPNMELKVEDIDSRTLLGPNQKGEICIRSNNLMKSYYNLDSSTCYDDEGFIKTGDIGYYDEDECIYVVDRIKDMFKYSSWHVVPSYLEALLQQHPAVKEAVVFGIPHEKDEFHPAACLVLKENVKANVDEIQAFYSPQVSEANQLRGGIKILDVLPKTPNHKIQRRIIKDIFLNTL